MKFKSIEQDIHRKGTGDKQFMKQNKKIKPKTIVTRSYTYFPLYVFEFSGVMIVLLALG